MEKKNMEKEELEVLKKEYKELSEKLKELSEDELNEVVGGGVSDWLEKMKKKIEEYYSNTNDPTEELPSQPLPSVDPRYLDEIINK